MPDLETSVRAIAARLDDVASSVATEAANLTSGLRSIGDHARDITMLAVELEQAAESVDSGLQVQLDLVTEARKELSDNKPALAALSASAEVISSMATSIREIAAKSRMLSLNARIEAARVGAGTGFAAVAQAMSQLTIETGSTSTNIETQAAGIELNVKAASGIIATGTTLADHQHGTLGSLASATAFQRSAAGALRQLTTETVERVDDAAVGVGRVSSAASIVGLLARQMVKLLPALPAERIAA